MNKEQYMKALKRRLRHLPREDFNRAVEYFEEYFAEAGSEGEQQAVIDLGAPEEAAEQIIRDLAIANTEKPVKGVKKGISAVWIGILGVCAAPVALPVLLFVLLAVIFLLLAVLLVFLGILLCGGLLILSAPVSLIGGFGIITDSVPAALICFGNGLMGAALGILTVYGMGWLIKIFLGWLVKLFGHAAKKGGKTDEEGK